MKEEESFRNDALSLGMLAEKIGISVSELSLFLNSVLQKNFYHFINEFRVDYATSLLRQKEVTILEVAYMSGFSAKSSFNRTFKKIVGVTPSQFQLRLGEIQ